MCLWVLRQPNIVKIVLDTIYIFILSYWGRNFWYHTIHAHESRKAKVPYISVDDKPAAKALKSMYNIRRERAWRPLYEKELQISNPPWSWSRIGAGVRPKQSYSWVSLFSIARLLVTRIVLIASQNFTQTPAGCSYGSTSVFTSGMSLRFFFTTSRCLR